MSHSNRHLQPLLRAVMAVCLVAGVAAPLLDPRLGFADKKTKPLSAPQLIKAIATSPAGKERDTAVDHLLELGPAAWPEVRAALPQMLALDGGEDVTVDLLLGYGAVAWDEIVARGPKLANAAALRLVRQVLRYPTDDRQVVLFEAMLSRDDEELLLLVLPELVQRNRPPAMPRLMQLLDDKRPSLRGYAIDTLVAQHWEPALPQLVRRLGQERLQASPDNLNVRLKLINAIGHIGAQTEAPVAALMEAVEVADQRDAALDALQVVGAPAVRAAVYMLQTAERTRIETALQVLSHLRVQSAPQLVPLLATSKDEVTRGLVVDVLTHLAVPEVRGVVLQMLRERKFASIEQGLQLAIALYDDQVRAVLSELLVDRDPAVRKVAVQQTWRLADPQNLPLLRRVAASDDDVGVRLLALRAMVGQADPKAVDYLRKLSVVNNLQERIEVLQLLGRVDDERGVATLARQLSDPNDQVFRTALNSLRALTFHSGPRREAEWLAWLQTAQQAKAEEIDSMEPRRRRFVVDGRELGWLEMGDSGDQTVVVIAGTPYRDATHLTPHAWHLAKYFHVVVMQRGIGALTAATLSESHRAAELTQLQAALGKSRMVLLADATAAHFALRYASDHANEVPAVILHGAPWPSALAMRRMPAQIAAAMPLPWRDDAAWARGHTGLLHPDLQLRILGRSHHATVMATPEPARRLRDVELFYDGFSVEAADRVAGDAQGWDVANVSVPVLLLHGKKAPWAATAEADLAALPAEVRKRLHVVPIEGCGSMPLVEKPDDAVRAIASFLP